MEPKKIGAFLKELRREKGITQEQLGEMLGVSGRTVSRWETGFNMPDLSILIELAEYYEVEIKEILDGERKSESMDKEMKETLIKVADYNELERNQVAKAGNMAFGIMFVLCAVLIVVQLLLTGDLMVTLGETAVLLVGGAAYIGVMVYRGIWSTGSRIKSTPFSDAMISVVSSGVFSAVFAFYMIQRGAQEELAARMALAFFAGIGVLGFIVLRVLALFSDRRKNKAASEQSGEKKHTVPVEIFIADGSLQADMLVDVLKQEGIAAYKQDLGNAGFTAVRYGMGRIGDDRVAVYVADDRAEEARRVVERMGMCICEDSLEGKDK